MLEHAFVQAEDPDEMMLKVRAHEEEGYYAIGWHPVYAGAIILWCCMMVRGVDEQDVSDQHRDPSKHDAEAAVLDAAHDSPTEVSPNDVPF